MLTAFEHLSRGRRDRDGSTSQYQIFFDVLVETINGKVWMHADFLHTH